MNELQKKNLDLSQKILIFILSGFSSSFFAGMILSSAGVEPWTVGYILLFLFFIIIFFQGLILLFSFIFGKFEWCYSYQVIIFYKVSDKIQRTINQIKKIDL